MPLTDEQRDWLNLMLVPGIGTTYFIRLLARFQTPGRVLQASEAALRDVVGPALARRVRQYREVVDLPEQERLLARYDAHVVTLEDSNYPPRLAEIYDPPLVLFVRGNILECDTHAVAIVGTRKASPYGARMAGKLATELAGRGITVVSGMALGIDTAAHLGALDAGGRTFAVLGCGVDSVYPKENDALMARIITQGAVVSPFPMGVTASKGHFPFRNRIISGLSLGACIVEAPLRSGALITARQAAEQGREVFAVPGQVGHENSQGPHALIQEGAKLVQSVDDMLVELDVPAEVRVRPVRLMPAAEPPRPEATPRPAPSRPQPVARPVASPPPLPRTAPTAPRPASTLTPQEQRVLSVLSNDGSFVDEIAQATRISVAEALSTLTMLELKGLARQFSGKRFAPR
jgi:DNA processing protein